MRYVRHRMAYFAVEPSSYGVAPIGSLQPCRAPCHTRTVDTQTVVILDFGSQYTQLIARRIRELNVFSVVLPCTVPIAEIRSYKPIGIILSGGPSSVYDADAPVPIRRC